MQVKNVRTVYLQQTKVYLAQERLEMCHEYQDSILSY